MHVIHFKTLFQIVSQYSDEELIKRQEDDRLTRRETEFGLDFTQTSTLEKCILKMYFDKSVEEKEE